VITRIENGAAMVALAAMVSLPLIEVAGRLTGGHGVPGAIVLVQHLTLWIALAGAALAARSDRLLGLSTPHMVPERWRTAARLFTSALAAGISATLVWASLDFVRVERNAGEIVALGIPAWWVLAVLPVGFAVVAVRLILRAADTVRARTLAAVGSHSSTRAGLTPRRCSLRSSRRRFSSSPSQPRSACPFSPRSAAPRWCSSGPTARHFLPFRARRTGSRRRTCCRPCRCSPSRGTSCRRESSARLTRAHRVDGVDAGGLARHDRRARLLYAADSASGVTIVSMGGLLLPVLLKSRYAEPTSLGLVTVSGSIGLLFFPSLPVFLYGFYANQPFAELFVGGLLPGVLLVLVVGGWAAVRGRPPSETRAPFRAREAAAAVWDAKWTSRCPSSFLAVC
jgi:TRAP-type C4-dicarboxylate transport system permease small subunit